MERHHYMLCEDSYEATAEKGGYRHYKCTDPGCDDEYSYETAPTVYKVNPKTGAPVDQKKAINPYLPNFEMLPDNELQVFWSKKDQEWRVYVTGSHDALTDGRWCGNDVVCWSAPVYDLSDWRYEGVTRDGGWFFACDFAYDLKTDSAVFYAFPFFTNPGMDGTHLWLNGNSDPSGYFDIPLCEAGIAGIDDTGWNFDPGILIEDNGNITCVWDIQQTTDDVPKHAQITRLNEDRTAILWSHPVMMAEGEKNTKGYTPNDYEANTLNYIPEFDVYVLQYSSVYGEGAKDGQGYYPLAYCYTFDKDLEHALWHWGGVISDNSGCFKKNLQTGKIEDSGEAAYSWDNNHGGLVYINGDWYISNHRHIGTHACRQGFLAKVDMRVENGRLIIEPTEYTTSISGSIDAYETIHAYTACHITPCQNYSLQDENEHYIHPRTYIATFKGENEKNNGFVYDDPAYALHRTPIVDIQNQTEIGFKYLDFAEGKEALTLTLLVSKETGYVDGSADIYIDAPAEAKGGIRIGTIAIGDLSAAPAACIDTGKVEWKSITAAMDRTVTGVHAIYLVFHAAGEGIICKLDEIKFA